MLLRPPRGPQQRGHEHPRLRVGWLVSAVTSKSFKVLGLHLVIKSQPKTADVNDPLNFTIAVEDSKNNLVTNSSAAVELQHLTVLAGAAGTFDYPAFSYVSNGVVSFSLTLATPGTFTIEADAVNPQTVDVNTGEYILDNSITGVTSKSFKIVGLHLAYIAPPKTTDATRPKP